MDVQVEKFTVNKRGKLLTFNQWKVFANGKEAGIVGPLQDEVKFVYTHNKFQPSEVVEIQRKVAEFFKQESIGASFPPPIQDRETPSGGHVIVDDLNP